MADRVELQRARAPSMGVRPKLVAGNGRVLGAKSVADQVACCRCGAMMPLSRMLRDDRLTCRRCDDRKRHIRSRA